MRKSDVLDHSLLNIVVFLARFSPVSLSESSKSGQKRSETQLKRLGKSESGQNGDKPAYSHFLTELSLSVTFVRNAQRAKAKRSRITRNSSSRG